MQWQQCISRSMVLGHRVQYLPPSGSPRLFSTKPQSAMSAVKDCTRFAKNAIPFVGQRVKLKRRGPVMYVIALIIPTSFETRAKNTKRSNAFAQSANVNRGLNSACGARAAGRPSAHGPNSVGRWQLQSDTGGQIKSGLQQLSRIRYSHGRACALRAAALWGALGGPRAQVLEGTRTS